MEFRLRVEKERHLMDQTQNPPQMSYGQGTLSWLMKLHIKTSGFHVYLFADTITVTALLLFRKLPLIGMVSRLEQNPLKTLALETLIEEKKVI